MHMVSFEWKVFSEEDVKESFSINHLDLWLENSG